MIKEFLMQTHAQGYFSFALLFFFFFFTGSLIWVFRKQANYRDVSLLPLQEDENHVQ